MAIPVQGYTYGIPPNFFIEAARGVIPEAVTLGFGATLTNINATEKLLWDGGIAFPRQTTSSPLSVVSTSALDTISGTGARLVFAFGIDHLGNQVYEFVALNGTTPVVTATSFAEPLLFVVLDGGSAAQLTGNQGTITATKTNNSQLWGHIAVGEGQCRYGFTVVPVGRIAIVDGIQISVAGLASADIKVWLQGFVIPGGPTPPVLVYHDRIDGGSGPHFIDLRHGPAIVPPLSRIAITARNPLNNNNMFVSVNYTVMFSPDSLFVRGNIPV